MNFDFSEGDNNSGTNSQISKNSDKITSQNQIVELRKKQQKSSTLQHINNESQSSSKSIRLNKNDISSIKMEHAFIQSR